MEDKTLNGVNIADVKTKKMETLIENYWTYFGEDNKNS